MSDKYDIDSLVGFAADQKPVEFDKAFLDVVHDKIVAAVQAKKEELAKTMFAPPEENFDDEEDWEEEE